MSAELLAIGMFAVVLVTVMAGFPAAFTLAGVGTLTALLASSLGVLDFALLGSLASRYMGIMTTEVFVAVPLFIFMGITLERSGIAEELLETMGRLFGNRGGGLAYSVIIVGALLAASSGIVGATVITMGLLSLPAMLRARYDPRLATGVICASGTLGQVIPPSTVLIFIANLLQTANQRAQMELGNFAAQPVSVGQLFAGTLLPGLMLVGLYLFWIAIVARVRPASCPPLVQEQHGPLSPWVVVRALVPPVGLIVCVLGSILAGIATPTESASFGVAGALILATLRRRLSLDTVKAVMQRTMTMTSMVFVIFLGASVFSLVFRGLGGDELVAELLQGLPGGRIGALALVLGVMFLLGFFLDTLEIIFIVIPITAPALIMLGVDPVWLGVLVGLTLQTSFLTPPFGFALFYLRSVVPRSIRTEQIYRGIVPFVGIQILAIAIVIAIPSVATYLPEALYGPSPDTPEVQVQEEGAGSDSAPSSGDDFDSLFR